MSKIAFSFSTVFLLGMFFLAMSFLIWMMVKTCRDLSLERPLTSPSDL
jgi:hypothetical protein